MFVVSRGQVVSFDRIKGYGFVAPEDGGEDVFLHVNDLFGDKNLLVPGSVVEYSLEEGERGPKASSVTVIESRQPNSVPLASGSLQDHRPSHDLHTRAADDDDESCDVLSVDELEQEFTEALLRTEPTLTGQQILDARARLISIATSHGWTLADRD